MVAQERKIIALKMQLADHRKRLRQANAVIAANSFNLDGKAQINRTGGIEVSTPVPTDLNLVRLGKQLYQFNVSLGRFTRVRG